MKIFVAGTGSLKRCWFYTREHRSQDFGEIVDLVCFSVFILNTLADLDEQQHHGPEYLGFRDHIRRFNAICGSYKCTQVRTKSVKYLIGLAIAEDWNKLS